MDTIKIDREESLKYSHVLLDIDLIISAPCNESIKVVKDLSKNAV